jgi:hypothetical protein
MKRTQRSHKSAQARHMRTQSIRASSARSEQIMHAVKHSWQAFMHASIIGDICMLLSFMAGFIMTSFAPAIPALT